MFTKSMVVFSTAIILGVAAMAPAVAAGSKGAKQSAAKQSFAQAFSSNPSNDVYLNGAHVGSDPDPRIRWSILKEARGKVGN